MGMSIKKIAAICILASFFLGAFTLIAISKGIAMALVIFAITAVVGVALIWACNQL